MPTRTRTGVRPSVRASNRSTHPSVRPSTEHTKTKTSASDNRLNRGTTASARMFSPVVVTLMTWDDDDDGDDIRTRALAFLAHVWRLETRTRERARTHKLDITTRHGGGGPGGHDCQRLCVRACMQ